MEFEIEDKYLKLLEILEKELSGDSSHTVDHIQRVWQNAMLIASEEKDIDLDVLKTAVLLHDIAKGLGGNHSIVGAEIALALCPRLGRPGNQPVAREGAACLDGLEAIAARRLLA